MSIRHHRRFGQSPYLAGKFSPKLIPAAAGAPPLYVNASVYNGQPTTNGVILDTTAGGAGQTNGAVELYNADLSFRWVAQIAMRNAEGKLNTPKIVVTPNNTIVTLWEINSDGAGAGAIFIDIYDGTADAGAYNGALVDTLQTEVANNATGDHGYLVVAYDINDGSVVGWHAAIIDSSSVGGFANIISPGDLVDTDNDALRIHNWFQGPTSLVGVTPVTAVYSNGVKVEQHTYARPGAAAYGVAHAEVQNSDCDYNGAYVLSSFTHSYSETNASGSFFPFSQNPQKTGNGARYALPVYSTHAGVAVSLLYDEDADTVGPDAWYFSGNVLNIDAVDNSLRWAHGISRSNLSSRDHRMVSASVCANGDVVATGWGRANTGLGTGEQWRLTATDGPVVFTQSDQDVDLVKWDDAGNFIWLKRAVVNTTGNNRSRPFTHLVDEENGYIYLLSEVQKDGGQNFIWGNGEATTVTITDANLNPFHDWVLSKHSLATGDLQWIVRIQEQPLTGSNAFFTRLSLRGGELFLNGGYSTGASADSGVVFGLNAGTAGHGAGSPITLTPNGAGAPVNTNTIGRFVIDADNGEALRFDSFTTSQNATNQLNSLSRYSQ